jgi:hypothetical protein
MTREGKHRLATAPQGDVRFLPDWESHGFYEDSFGTSPCSIPGLSLALK